MFISHVPFFSFLQVNSAQEKLTDTTVTDSQCSAEPEVSGAHTEEPTDKDLKRDAEGA